MMLWIYLKKDNFNFNWKVFLLIFLKTRIFWFGKRLVWMSSSLGLTYILSLGLCDDEGATARLLRDPVIVHLPVEFLPVLLPPIPDKKNNSLTISINYKAYWKTGTEKKNTVGYLAERFDAVTGRLSAWCCNWQAGCKVL